MKNVFKINKCNLLFVLLCFLLVLVFVISLCAALFFSSKIINVVSIKSREDLEIVRSDTEKGIIKRYKIDNPIDMGNEEWVPIGTKDKPFVGVFDGTSEDKAISNIVISADYINDSDEEFINCGLFSCIGKDAIVMHLFLANFTISDNVLSDYSNKINFGGIAGTNEGYITSCYVYNEKNTFKERCGNMGLFAGVNIGQIKNCFVPNRNYNFTIVSNTNVGILTGLNKGVIEDFNFTGQTHINVLGNSRFYGVNFGLVGKHSSGSIKNVSLKGRGSSLEKKGYPFSFFNVENSAITYGGIVGEIALEASSTISNIYADTGTSMSYYFDNVCFGFLFGKVLTNDYLLSINNCCCGGEIKSELGKVGTVSSSFDNVNKIISNNVVFFQMSTNSSDTTNSLFSEYVSIVNVSLSSMNWDKEKVWKQDLYSFYIEVLF